MARPKRQTKKFVGLFNQPIWDKLQEIKTELGIPYDISAIEWCIMNVHDDRNAPYKLAQKNRTPRETDPEKKIEKKMEEDTLMKKMKKEENYKKGMEISEALEGKVIDHGNGFYSVEYKVYDLSTPHYVSVGKMTVPFEQLDETKITNQYKASVPYEGDLKEVIKSVLDKQE